MRSRTACLFLIVMMVVAVGCRPATRRGAPLFLSVAHSAPIDYHYQAGLEHFARLLGRRTNGRVELAIIADGGAGTEDQLVAKVRDGKLEMALVSSSAVGTAIDPALLVLDLPYLFKNRAQAHRVIDGRFGRLLSDRLPAHGVRNLAWWENGFVDLTSSARPIKKPRDVSGLRIAATDSEVGLLTLKSLGAQPFMLSPPLPARAVVRRTAAGQAVPAALAAAESIPSQRYLSATHHAYSPAMLIIGSVTYANLRPSVRSALEWAAAGAQAYERTLSAASERAAVRDFAQGGRRVAIPDVPAFRKTTATVYNSARGALGSRISDGAEMLNKAVVASKRAGR